MPSALVPRARGGRGLCCVAEVEVLEPGVAAVLLEVDAAVRLVDHERVAVELGAAAGPARQGVLGARAMLLVRVRMFDGSGVIDTLTGEPADTEDVYSDLRPSEARALAFELLCCAEHAERIAELAGWWQR